MMMKHYKSRQIFNLSLYLSLILTIYQIKRPVQPLLVPPSYSYAKQHLPLSTSKSLIKNHGRNHYKLILKVNRKLKLSDY